MNLTWSKTRGWAQREYFPSWARQLTFNLALPHKSGSTADYFRLYFLFCVCALRFWRHLQSIRAQSGGHNFEQRWEDAEGEKKHRVPCSSQWPESLRLKSKSSPKGWATSSARQHFFLRLQEVWRGGSGRWKVTRGAHTAVCRKGRFMWLRGISRPCLS